MINLRTMAGKPKRKAYRVVNKLNGDEFICYGENSRTVMINVYREFDNDYKREFCFIDFRTLRCYEADIIDVDGVEITKAEYAKRMGEEWTVE